MESRMNGMLSLVVTVVVLMVLAIFLMRII